MELTRDLNVSTVQTNASGLEEISLQAAAARCRGYYQFFCSAVVLFVTWVFRTWWNFLPTAAIRHEGDYASFGAALERLDRENHVLRQEVGALNRALSEFFSVAGRLRDDLDGVTADHDRLAEQVGWQHVGMVRLGGFNPYQGLSIQQRQQVFARERRNMMAYRSTPARVSL